MKRLTTLIALALLLAMPLLAQEKKRPRFSPEEFKARMETFITQRAELTQAEAEKLFPIFHEMKEKQSEMMKKMQKLKHKSGEQFEREGDYESALSQLGKLGVDCAKIEETYYKKMAKAVSARKAYDVRMADDAFHREMLQHFNKPKDKKPPRR